MCTSILISTTTWRDHGWDDLPGSGESNSSIFSTTGTPIAILREWMNAQFPCLTTVRLGYWPHASCQNFSCPKRGGATHHVWYSLEGGPYSGTRIRGNCYRFPRFRHGESA